jgi:hypothetical protein
MPSVAFNKFQSFVEAEAEKAHNLGADTLRILLTNVAPVATNTVKANLTEITAANGYPANGPQASQTSSAQTGGIYKLVLGDVTITAAGGSIGPFRYAVLYNDTATNDELIGWYDYGTAGGITVGDGENFVVDFDGTNGVFTKQ